MKRNAAYNRSLKKGDVQMVGETEYRGRNPMFKVIPAHKGKPAYAMKISKGIPFVRVNDD